MKVININESIYKVGNFLDNIILGDCIDIMKQIPDETIDLIVADPPYNVSVKGNKITRNYDHYKWKRRTDIGLDFGEWDRNWRDDKEYFQWVELWFKEAVRVLKPKSWIYIFFDKQKIGIFDLYLAPKYGIKSRTIYVWIKTNPVPSFRKVNWLSASEFIWVGSKGDAKLKNFLDQKDMYNYFIHPNSSSYGVSKHPTEKPVELISHLILVNSNQDDIVLDPFIGSGTTAVSALKLRRYFIGIDNKPEYVIMSKQRIKLFISQGRLDF